ncbi:MAG: 30S ribosomal protein S15 [Thermoplasmata archaeon]|nr:30S ribosomal protein S15 [Thermoplasmata archaeon]NIS10619.1 30S ribosomal protein S15 [Thermoplasmata archaeon]NIS18581.1 30S ribosomal protein S15 [Thermoplasmata archaeon]NIT75569.1 30S ribosomal protein S15 [Thermoplasmata archaeon]NIU47732.1 30S ribosomal protein S15 [Thermoplasmata archaeon]
MARMHTRRRGRSGSSRPFSTENPSWVPLTSEEIEEKVVELAGNELSTSIIGIRMRDEYAVPSVKLATGKSITQILTENEMSPERPEDLENLMRKAINLSGHLQRNPKDLHNKRALQLIEAKIRRLVRYYKDTGKLPSDFRYSLDTARLMVE